MESSRCDCGPKFDGASAVYKRVLWIVIFINAVMFVVEMGAGLSAQSQALKADALDFLTDTTTYAISFYVIGRSVRLRTNAALFKGISLGAVGVWVLGSTIYQVFVVGVPVAFVMGTVGIMALVANVGCALLLTKFRNGDANVRSVWLCSRNDAIGNLAVVLAAGGVWATDTVWPDLLVAIVVASLFLSGAIQIVRQARTERRQAADKEIDGKSRSRQTDARKGNR